MAIEASVGAEGRHASSRRQATEQWEVHYRSLKHSFGFRVMEYDFTRVANGAPVESAVRGHHKTSGILPAGCDIEVENNLVRASRGSDSKDRAGVVSSAVVSRAVKIAIGS